MENLVVNASFWRGKRVFITGHTGFKGSWLSLWLKDLGAQVTGYSLPAPTNPSLFESARVAEGMTSLIQDVRDFNSLNAALKQHEPEVVFHLAAQALVRHSYANPRETYETNVMGTVNLLEAIRQNDGVRAAVVVTSDKCYENREWVWGYRENEPMGGYDPYSSSKACAELVTAAYRQSFFINPRTNPAAPCIASARAGNVIGGGDWADDRLIPDAMRAFARGEPVHIRYPDAIRPWQHVLEPLRGYLMLAEALAGENGHAWAEAWNFGPQDDDARPVRWVMDRLCALWPQGRWQRDDAERPHEAGYLKLDCAKAHARLGWWPRLALTRALELTAEWYRAQAARTDVVALTRRQILDYMTNIDKQSE